MRPSGTLFINYRRGAADSTAATTVLSCFVLTPPRAGAALPKNVTGVVSAGEGGAATNRVGGGDGGIDQHGRTSRGAVGGGGALPVGEGTSGASSTSCAQMKSWH